MIQLPAKKPKTETTGKLQEGDSVSHPTHGSGVVAHVNGPHSITVHFKGGKAVELDPEDLE